MSSPALNRPVASFAVGMHLKVLFRTKKVLREQDPASPSDLISAHSLSLSFCPNNAGLFTDPPPWGIHPRRRAFAFAVPSAWNASAIIQGSREALPVHHLHQIALF